MATLKKTPERIPPKPVHQFQFILYAILLMLCALATTASIVLAMHLI